MMRALVPWLGFVASDKSERFRVRFTKKQIPYTSFKPRITNCIYTK